MMAITPPAMVKSLRPHPGPQEDFLRSSADVVFYGGAAGGGKTFAMLLEPMRHIRVPGFRSVIFRRTHPEITNQGGLWDTSGDLYSGLGRPRIVDTSWLFGMGNNSSVIRFAAMEHEKDKHKWQGAQICLLGFDELTHFSYSQFIYMLSRNRSVCGVKPYIRATCNPDPDSWVKDWVAWYIDEKTGYPIPERDGAIRFFARSESGEIVWRSSLQEMRELGHDRPKSFTFISANIYDNPTLLKTDPAYESNLRALLPHERARLLGGNWNTRATSGSYFRREWFEAVETCPSSARSVWFWDRAATKPSEQNPDPDYTVGLNLIEYRRQWYINNVVRLRNRPAVVIDTIKNIASQDPDATIVLEQEPGASGVAEIEYLVSELAGYDVRTVKPMSAKGVRAVPVSAQAQAGNVKIIKGAWNAELLEELEAFSGGEQASHDDQVDALSGAFNHFTQKTMPKVTLLS